MCRWTKEEILVLSFYLTANLSLWSSQRKLGESFGGERGLYKKGVRLLFSAQRTLGLGLDGLGGVCLRAVDRWVELQGAHGVIWLTLVGEMSTPETIFCEAVYAVIQ
jgi:hypothetical protein